MKSTVRSQAFHINSASTARATVLCGCGLSRTFPMCDGSQMIAKTHQLGRLFRCGGATQPAASEAQLETT
jgi:hypothetical protein